MRTKKNPEIPMVPKAHLKNVEHQRNQYKTERDTLIDDLKVLREKNEMLDEKLENHAQVMNWKHERTLEYRKQRDKAKNRISEIGQQISELERENEKLVEENEGLKDKEFNLIMENNDLITISSAIEQTDDYLRGKIEKLERENEHFKSRNTKLTNLNVSLIENNEVLTNTNNKYTTLTDHIRLKASANPGEHRYIALVNFVDRLERREDGD